MNDFFLFKFIISFVLLCFFFDSQFGYICYDPDPTVNDTAFNWVLIVDEPVPFDCGMVDDDAFKFTPMNFSDSLDNLEEKLNVYLWYYSLPMKHVQCYETSIYIVCRPVLGDQQYNPCADIETLVGFAAYIFTFIFVSYKYTGGTRRFWKL